MWYWYLIVGVVSFIFGMIAILLICPSCGTLFIDMNSRNDKDIARFIFEKPIENISEYRVMTLKIVKKDGLSSIDGKL